MKTVAVIGASPDRRKFGNKALRAFREAGYRVVPITPRHATVEGERAYATVLDYPEPFDVATIYVPPEIGEAIIDGVAAKGIAEVWFNPGSETAALLARARALGIDPIAGLQHHRHRHEPLAFLIYCDTQVTLPHGRSPGPDHPPRPVLPSSPTHKSTQSGQHPCPILITSVKVPAVAASRLHRLMWRRKPKPLPPARGAARG